MRMRYILSPWWPREEPHGVLWQGHNALLVELGGSFVLVPILLRRSIQGRNPGWTQYAHVCCGNEPHISKWWNQGSPCLSGLVVMIALSQTVIEMEIGADPDSISG